MRRTHNMTCSWNVYTTEKDEESDEEVSAPYDGAGAYVQVTSAKDPDAPWIWPHSQLPRSPGVQPTSGVRENEGVTTRLMGDDVVSMGSVL